MPPREDLKVYTEDPGPRIMKDRKLKSKIQGLINSFFAINDEL